jgi:excinuclease UvrABC ATPase subunit
MVGCLYILDEPSGLHKEIMKKIHSLEQLRDIGNSIVVNMTKT